MALNLKYNIVQDMGDGKSIYFTDVTPNYGIGGNINYGNVLAVRLYFGVYANEIAPTSLTANAELDQWREYKMTSLAGGVYDNKSIQMGQRYIPFVSGLTVLSNDTFDTTGRYSEYISPATYLPTSAINVLTRTTSDLGITQQNVFPDGVYYLTYEIYTVTSPNPIVNLVANTQYMVYGAGTCIYDGNTYRTGEVFIAANTNAVSFTGGAALVVLNSIVFQYFSLTFNIETGLATLILEMTKSCKRNDPLWFQVMVMKSKLDSVKVADIMNKTDAELAQQIILGLQVELDSIINQRR